MLTGRASKVTPLFSDLSYLFYSVYKDPITDKVKKSKRGKMALVKNGDEKLDFETIQHAQHMNGDIEAKDVLVPVFQDGEILVDFTLGPD